MRLVCYCWASDYVIFIAGDGAGWSLSYINGLMPKFYLTANAAGVAASDTQATSTSWVSQAGLL